PEKFVNTYRHWMANVKDWCISRQLWWGQRIPAWYDNQGNWVVAKTEEEALEEFLKLKDIDGVFTADEKAGFKNQLKPFVRQDDDVMDTWFSSWLWPISVFDGFKNPDNKDINYY